MVPQIKTASQEKTRNDLSRLLSEFRKLFLKCVITEKYSKLKSVQGRLTTVNTSS